MNRCGVFHYQVGFTKTSESTSSAPHFTGSVLQKISLILLRSLWFPNSHADPCNHKRFTFPHRPKMIYFINMLNV